MENSKYEVVDRRQKKRDGDEKWMLTCLTDYR